MVLADLTFPLFILPENTDIEENIKSIKAIPTKTLKNSESPKPASLLATNEKNISEIMKVIRIS